MGLNELYYAYGVTPFSLDGGSTDVPSNRDLSLPDQQKKEKILNIPTPISQEGIKLQSFLYDQDIFVGAPSSYNFLDPTYALIGSDPTSFVGVSNIAFLGFWDRQIDENISTLLLESSKVLDDINNSIVSLSEENIRKSLNPEVDYVLYNLANIDGRQIDKYKITKAIVSRLLSNSISIDDASYILSLKGRAVEATTNNISKSSINLPKSKYGISKSNLRKQRELNLNIANVNIQIPITANINRGIINALQNKKTLDFSKEENIAYQELLKLWYILPEDIFRRYLVQTADGEKPIYIKNTETINIITSSLDTIKIPVSKFNYFLPVDVSGGVEIQLSSVSEIHRAVTLSNSMEQACLFDIGEEYETDLIVTSPSAADLEITYSLSATRPIYYVLKLKRDSIIDSSLNTNIYITKTTAQYEIESSTSAIQELIEFRAFPWKIFAINHMDPIFGHFSTSSTYTFTFSNFSLNKFGTSNEEPIFVRKVPEIIIIAPTDFIKYDFYSGNSVLIDWNSRNIKFVHSPDPTLNKTGLQSHFLKYDSSYPGTDIFGEQNQNGQKMTYITSSIKLNLFKFGEEQILSPRQRHGFRAAVEIANKIYLNYKVDGGLLWSDILQRMTELEYKTLRSGINRVLFDQLMSGQKTYTKIFHNSDTIYNKETNIKEVRSSAPDLSSIDLIKKLIKKNI